MIHVQYVDIRHISRSYASICPKNPPMIPNRLGAVPSDASFFRRLIFGYIAAKTRPECHSKIAPCFRRYSFTIEYDVA